MEIFTTEPRIEIKYTVGDKGLNKFLKYLRNSGFIRSFSTRKVNSIYYDDIANTCIKDNIAGITPRKKYRLRWYGKDLKNINNIRYEIKRKKGILGEKNIIKINSDINLEKINFSMKGLQDLMGNHDEKIFPTNYYPQLLCIYEREYFENNLMRFTLDSKIRFKSFCRDTILKEYRNNYLDYNQKIIELKVSPDNLEDARLFFKEIPINSSRCSKYLIGQQKLNKVIYI